MSVLIRIASFLVCVGILAGSPLDAQPPVPVGADAEPVPPEEPPVAPAPRPPNPIADRAVQALLETQPSTPSEQVRAIEVLIDLGRPDAAKPFLTQLLGANLDAASLAGLGEQFGTSTFLKIAVEPQLAPEGQQLAAAVTQASEQQARDPQRLAGYIAQLQDPSPSVRARAVVGLRSGGSAAVVALIALLADEGRAAEHEVARSALVALGEVAVPPLLATLAAPDERLRAQAIEVLGRLRAREAIPYLLAPAVSPKSPAELKSAARVALVRLMGTQPEPQQAAGLLYSHAGDAYARAPLMGSVLDSAEVWTWDPTQNLPVAAPRTRPEASLAEALQLSRDLYELLPSSRLALRLYLGALLESTAYTAGLGHPLPQDPGTAYEFAAAQGPAVIEDLLSESMNDGHLPAATAAAMILGDIGSDELLRNRGADPSVLVRAAHHGNRRLRFAAVDAILRIGPEKPFPGSHQVVRALTFFAGPTGIPKALVVATQAHEASRLGGLLAALGYDFEVASDGRAIVEIPRRSPDFELLLADFRLARADVGQLVQQLRLDHRTAELPVALVVSSQDRLAAERVAHEDPRTQVFIRPTDLAAMQFQVEQFLPKLPHQVTADERLEHARRSLEWLAALSEPGQSLYDLQTAQPAVETAVFVPELAPMAAAVLANLGSPRAQGTLVDLASQSIQPLSSRQAAAEAFAGSVQRYGLLLTSPEVLRQYDRYNQSEHEPPETQQILAAILDAIETRLDPSRPRTDQPVDTAAP